LVHFTAQAKFNLSKIVNEGATVGSVIKRNKMKKRDAWFDSQLGQTLIKKVNEGATVNSVMKRKKIKEKNKEMLGLLPARENLK
jgi:hypothetical protein